MKQSVRPLHTHQAVPPSTSSAFKLISSMLKFTGMYREARSIAYTGAGVTDPCVLIRALSPARQAPAFCHCCQVVNSPTKASARASNEGKEEMELLLLPPTPQWRR
jgi:hypothetical protein